MPTACLCVAGGLPRAAPPESVTRGWSLLSPEGEVGGVRGRTVNGTRREAGGFYSSSFLGLEGRERGRWRFEQGGKIKPSPRKKGETTVTWEETCPGKRHTHFTVGEGSAFEDTRGVRDWIRKWRCCFLITWSSLRLSVGPLQDVWDQAGGRS